MSIDAAVGRIRAYARQEGLTKGRLAVQARLRDTVLRRFDEANWNPTLTTLRKLEAVVPANFVAEPKPGIRGVAAKTRHRPQRSARHSQPTRQQQTW